MKHTSVLALLICTATVALPVQAQHTLTAPSLLRASPSDASEQPVDRIIAIVEDDVILQSELNEAVANVRQQYAANPGELPPEEVLERQVLNRIILTRLQVQKANDQGIQLSNADVDQATQAVAEQNHLTIDQLRSAVEQHGQSFEAFQRQLADQLMVQKLHDSVIHNQVTVTDSEVDNLLASPSYRSGEVHLAHIQISLPSGANAADIKHAADKAGKAEAALNGGMDFHAAAIRYSDANDALQGGDIGWRRLSEVPPEFADAVVNLGDNGVSQPLRTPNGFQIIKLLGRRSQQQATLVTEYHAREILIKTTELVSEQQAQEKAQSLYQQLSSRPTDFAKLAKENSNDDSSANLGGDMGWFPQNGWGPAVGQVVTQLKDGEISQPFQTDAGWIVMQRLGSRQSDQSSQIARDQAKQAIGNRKAEEAYDNFLRQLRSSAYVKILVPELRAPENNPTAQQPTT